MEFTVTGKITKVLELQSGVSKAGKAWEKESFIVETSEDYNNLYCFEIFGADKTSDFNQKHKPGDVVKVHFNVNTNEWNDKYFTSLSAWRIEPVSTAAPKESDLQKTMNEDLSEDETDDLPF